MSNLPTFDPATAIYTPPEVMDATLKAVQKMREKSQRGINLGISGIDDYFAPLMPGQICSIIAQTSNYKSGTMHCIQRHAVKQLERQGRDEMLIHVSTEEDIEEQGFLEIARVTGITVDDMARGNISESQLTKLERSVVRLGAMNIYRIGTSVMRSEDSPDLYLSNIIRVIQFARKRVRGEESKIAGIYVDYLQALPLDPETKKHGGDSQRRLQVRQDFYRLRKYGNYFECPIWLAVQAKQNLQGAPGHNMLIPGNYDGEETSTIAQRSDRIISQWLPKMTHQMGTEIEHKNYRFTVDENLMFMKIGKQRGGLPSGRTFQCRVDYLRNEIGVEKI